MICGSRSDLASAWAALGLALAGLALLPALARAEGSAELARERLAAVRTWDFVSTALGADGQPRCRETWTFRPDGTASVHSADQRTEENWRTEQDGHGLAWLRITPVSVNTAADCLGNVADPAAYPRPETGMVMRFLDDGRSADAAFLCRAPDLVRGPTGKPVPVFPPNACWGLLQSHDLPPESRMDPSQWRIVEPQ